MAVAVDTNVLLDVLLNVELFALQSRAALDEFKGAPLVVSEPVYAELAANFSGRPNLQEFLEDAEIAVQPSSTEALKLAGERWRQYLHNRRAEITCSRCGASQDLVCSSCGSDFLTRQHILADFMIGAHALVTCGRLLTRDRGYFATYFPELGLAWPLTPGASPGL